MNKKYIIIFILLIISIAVNIKFVTRSEFVEDGPCDNIGRYSEKEGVGAIRLDSVTARELVAEYKHSFPPDSNGNPPTGYVFTKRMFDQIFQDTTVNSVTLDLVTYNKKVSLVVKGFKTISTKIDKEGTDNIYVVQSFCPSDCSSW